MIFASRLAFIVHAVVFATSCRAAEAPSSSGPGANEPDAVTIVDEAKLAIGEASAVVALGGGRFLVADDEKGVQLVDVALGKVQMLAPMNDVEGLAKVGDRFIAIEERSGVVWGFGLDGVTKQLGALAHPPFTGEAKKNKGWEGIALLPAKLAADKKDHLVAVHEGTPKALALFAWPALTLEKVLALEGPLDGALGDLSDVAIDPANGELLLLSDQSRRFARVRLGDALALVRLTDLPIAEEEKAEGVTFDDTGLLWIVTDATGRLFRVMLVPSRER